MIEPDCVRSTGHVRLKAVSRHLQAVSREALTAGVQRNTIPDVRAAAELIEITSRPGDCPSWA